MSKDIRAILFDLGGTLRIAKSDDDWQRVARIKMAKLAGTALPYEQFYELAEERYAPYRIWALT